MGAREEIQKRIDKKRAEQALLESQIAEIKTQVKEVASYIQALEDTLKILPREGADIAPSQSAYVLRPGSAVARVQEFLEKSARPMHITDILDALGKPQDAGTRSGLSGSISAYVRDGKIFTRPAPNTFGLIGMANMPRTGNRATKVEGPPSNFGVNEAGEDIDRSYVSEDDMEEVAF